MKHILPLVFSAILPVFAWADDTDPSAVMDVIRPAGDSDLSEFLWTKRPVVVFADNAADPRYAEQIELLSSRLDELVDRDVVILTDTDPGEQSPLRTKLRPRGFMLVLVAKDGGVLLRKPFPWSVRELTRSIDKLPSRQREVRERRGDS